MSEDALLFERHDAIATLALNRPEANNAISDEVRDALILSLDRIAASPSIRSLVITGAGDEAFSVGSDLGQLSTLTSREAEAFALKAKAVHQRLSRLSIPVIAALNGPCVGAGFELALFCDIRIARDDARCGLPGINVGLTPSGGAIERLSHLIGGGPARALALTGGIVSAERAFVLGLVTNVVGRNEFRPAVAELAQHLANLDPTSMGELKKLFDRGYGGNLDEAHDAGARAFAACFERGKVAERLREMYGGPGPDATVH